MDITLEKYVNTSFKDEIYMAIKNWTGEKLRDLKDSLPDDVSYFDIKYYLIKNKKECC